MGLARVKYRWMIALLIILVIVFGWPRKLLRPPTNGDGQPAKEEIQPGADEVSRAPAMEPAASMDPAGPAAAAPGPLLPPPEPLMRFQLPTANDALFKNSPADFFMFVDRYTPQGPIQVWEGGGYGFVRNPRDTPQGTVFTKFHEGIDIAPMQRDAKGEPQDSVHAIADGVVAYTTNSPRTSNYGHYVVLRHTIGKAG
ncbi:MAG: M23 family metallopeptidase, partial [Verrucomicrobiaceae bacterium]